MKRWIGYTLILTILLTTSTLLWALRAPKRVICRDGSTSTMIYNRDMHRITVREHFARARGKDLAVKTSR